MGCNIAKIVPRLASLTRLAHLACFALLVSHARLAFLALPDRFWHGVIASYLRSEAHHFAEQMQERIGNRMFPLR